MSKKTIELVCDKCGKTFIYRRNGNGLPQYCSYCFNKIRKAHEQLMEDEKIRLEEAAWRKQYIIDCKNFEEQLLKVTTIPLEDIVLDGGTLYIIGNGFDLMHGIKSSYRSFRDSMGKNNPLRNLLETYLKAEDIWADFESALGHVRMDMMANKEIIGDMLDMSGAFDEDAGAAEYYMAQEMAAEPMRMITEELDKRFRSWIEKLEIGTQDRPLKALIHDDKVLCFNYTEFIEKMYGVSEKNICYIHGCRRKKKGKSKERLILGHKPGASDEDFYEIEEIKKIKSYRSQMIDLAQEGVIGLLSEYDKKVTKDCQYIIALHKNFFKSLDTIENIVIIGHSVSPVDWDYFIEVAQNASKAKWYFGCHGIHDLENTIKLSTYLGIHPTIFRTDRISVSVIPEPKVPENIQRPKFKSIQSLDKKWRVQWWDKEINIIGNGMKKAYIMQEQIRTCVFSPIDDILFILIKGLDAGIPFFRLVDENWVYIDEIKPLPHQNVLNQRLRHVFATDNQITFVYNNRVREYSLETGALVRNLAKRDAKNDEYEGKEITEIFNYKLNFPSRQYFTNCYE